MYVRRIITKGVSNFFNLANFVNNQNLVKEIQGVIEANFKFKISDFFLPLVQTFSVSFFITPEQVTFKFPFQFDDILFSVIFIYHDVH